MTKGRFKKKDIITGISVGDKICHKFNGELSIVTYVNQTFVDSKLIEGQPLRDRFDTGERQLPKCDIIKL